MLPKKRLIEILDYIKKKDEKSAKVEELAKEFNASNSTIRRDLKKLEEQSMLERIHGGAILRSSTSSEMKAFEKRIINQKEKKHIGKIAKKYIIDGDSILLDSGSTVLEVANNLIEFNDLTVITYDLRIALDIELTYDSKLFVTGGERRNGFEVVYGVECVDYIKKLHVDKAFLGADAIDLNKGITNAHFPEVPIKKEIIRSADTVILVADSSKFNKQALIKVCELDEIDIIITDSEIDRNIYKKIKEKGVDIIY